YTVRLTAGGKTYTRPLTVKLDPRSTATKEDLQKQFELSRNCMRELSRAGEASRQVRAMNGPEASKIAAAIRTATGQINAALGVAQSAHRVPPESAYTLFGLGSRELTAQLSALKTLQAK